MLRIIPSVKVILQSVICISVMWKKRITPGCCKQFSRDEIFEILKEVM